MFYFSAFCLSLGIIYLLSFDPEVLAVIFNGFSLTSQQVLITLVIKQFADVWNL